MLKIVSLSHPTPSKVELKKGRVAGSEGGELSQVGEGGTLALWDHLVAAVVERKLQT